MRLSPMQDIIEGMPNIVPDEKMLAQHRGLKKEAYAPVSSINFSKIKSAFGIALHMHQPTIPAGGGDLASARLVCNLQHMWENMNVGDNHNAPVFFWCYQRMAEFIPELVNQGKNPRVMLDYSGNLLWGLREIEGGVALEKLKTITCEAKYFQNVEFTLNSCGGCNILLVV